MNAQKVIAEARAAGLQLTVQGGNLAIRGVGVRPAAIIEAIRLHKAEIIGVLQGLRASSSEGSELSEERQNQVPGFPPIGMSLPAVMPVLAPEERTRVIDLLMRQGKPAIGWCLRRVNAYFENFPSSSFVDQDAAAGLDLLNWQNRGLSGGERQTG